MDQEVKIELAAIESRLELALQKTIDRAIRSGIADIKNTIAELFNKDITHISAHLSRHDKYHEEHYTEFKRVGKMIDDVRAAIPAEVDKRQQQILDDMEDVKENLIKIKTSTETADKIDDKRGRKTELALGKVAILLTIVGLVCGLVGWLIR